MNLVAIVSDRAYSCTRAFSPMIFPVSVYHRGSGYARCVLRKRVRLR